MNFDEIKKAKELYKLKGILRRDLIRNEIAFSWVRSNLYKNKRKNEFIKNNYIFLGDKKILEKDLDYTLNQNIKFKSQNSKIIFVDLNGNIILNNSEVFKLKKISSLREEDIGTNAIGLTLKSKKNSTVYFVEHFSDFLNNYITSAFYFTSNYIKSNILVCIVTDLLEDYKIFSEYISDILNEKIKLNLVNAKKEMVFEFEDIEYPEVLWGNSKHIRDMRKKISKIVLEDIDVLIIEGEVGIGKEVIARYILNKGVDSKYISKINAGSDIEEEISRKINNKDNILIIEEVDKLNYKNLLDIQKKIDCKPVNTKQHSAYISNFICILSKEKNVVKNSSAVKKLIQNKKVFVLTFKGLNDRKDDIKYIVNGLLKNISYNQSIDINVLKNKILIKEILLKIINYEYKYNFRELKNIVESIVFNNDYSKLDTKFNDEYKMEFKGFNDLKPDKIYSLEHLEREYISSVFFKLDGNISLISEKLNISRSTLYRKLKKYEINL